MGKEVKIGLAVIGVLLCVFGGVLFFRLRREGPGTAQKKIAAVKKGTVKKDTEAKSPTQKAPQQEKPDKGRYDRFASNTAWSTLSHADDAAQPDANKDEPHDEQPPGLDSSPYRDRSRRGRYGEAAPAEDDSSDATTEETAQEDAGQEEDGRLGGLVMPDDRPVQGPADMAFSEDDQSAETDVSDAADGDTEEPTTDKRDTDDEQTEDRYAERRQTADRYARNRATDGSRYGERTGDDDAEEPSDPAESDDGTMQLSPLAGDQTENHPAASDGFGRRRYAQDQFDQDSVDDDQSDNERFGRDSETAQQAEDLADDAEPLADESVEERPARPRSDADSYVVEPNDNFWRISQKVYGTGAYFKALEAHNRRQQGDKRLINVGDVLSVPPLAVLREDYADLCPKPRDVPADRGSLPPNSSVRRARKRTYTVAEGDTLFDIARHELGKASLWAEIYQLNRQQLGEDFEYLTPGTQLVLPERDKEAAPIASRPRRGGYQR
ncbi:MAG TPA: LysM peptidoglycan-binding domain-containing protein [Pirellulales bacterium]|nr:LysM peptidoglycan-binding domain-containing protein [Pirellulales bacterium]